MIKAWKEMKRSEVYRKFSRKIDMVLFKLPNGTTSEFYIKNEGPAAAVFAMTEDKHVILVRQFRPGPQKIMLELPGGFVEDGESGKDAMQREFLEETGYEGELELVTMCYDDAYSTMRRFCFVAQNCRKIAEPQQSSNEQTEVVLLPLPKFRNLLQSGEMTDVEVGYLCLDYLDLL